MFTDTHAFQLPEPIVPLKPHEMPGFLPRKTEFEQAVDRAFKDAKELLLSKHKDYGPRNISRTPVGPEVGLIVRLHDKIARLAHLRSRGGAPKHEAETDTWVDIANYGIIGLLVNRGEWPDA